MRIKDLSIYGFKSFPEEVRFKFRQGITIFVGPNGSGKTNIFDAIKWIFGAQSPSQLRCEKIEDLLFFGSSSRKSPGFTEVRLVLENSGELPEFGPEIEIIRRFYRSQESDFYINRVSCRLKDIQDLGLRIGGLSYAFLENARIKEIIRGNIKRMFDESAGIARYYEKRDDALKRIQRSEDELKRLNDIIVEMMRNVRSLKRQVNKVIRLKRFEELKRKAEVKNIIQEIEKLEEEYREIVANRKRCEDKEKQCENRLRNLKEKLTTVEDYIAKNENKLARKKALYWEKNRLLIERDKRTENIRRLSKSWNKVKDRNLKQKDRIKDLDYKVQSLEDNLQSLVDEISQIDSELSGLIEDRQNFTTDHSTVLAEFKTNQVLKERFRSEISVQEGKELKLNQEIHDLNLEYQQLVMELNDLRREGKVINETYDSFLEKKHSLEYELNQKHKEFTEVTSAIESLKLMKDDIGPEVYKEKFKDRFIDMVYNLVKPMSGYEKAFDAIFGDISGYAVLSDFDPKVLKDLKDFRIGIIVTNRKSVKRMIKTPYGSFPEFLKPFFPAVKFFDTIPEEFTPPIVTKEGHLITDKIVRSASSGRFEIKTKLDLLNRQREDLREKIVSYQHELEKLEKTGLELKEKTRKIHTSISAKGQEIDKLSRRLEMRKEEHRQVLQKIQELTREITSVDTQITETSNRIQHESSNLEGLSSRIAELKKVLVQKRDDESRIRSDLEKLRLERSQILVEIETDRMRSDTIFKELKESRDRLDEVEIRLVEIDAEINEVGPIPEEAWERRKRLREEIDSIEKELKHIREEDYQYKLECYKRDEELKVLRERCQGYDPAIKDDVTVPDLEVIEEKIRQIGVVNPLAVDQYEEEKGRLNRFLKQKEDIEGAITKLKRSIRSSDRNAITQLVEKVQAVNLEFGLVFESVFGSGSGKVRFENPEKPLESPIEIVATLAGKRIKRLSQLSGGEQSLLALTLLFAFYRVNPAPFLILDEVDAPLDDNNVRRLCGFLKELAKNIQIIIITHNPRTIKIGDYLYGVTMEEPGVSKVVSIDFRDVARIME